MRDSSPPGPEESTADTAAIELCATTLHETLRGLQRAGNAGASYEAVGTRCGVAKQRVNEWAHPLYADTPNLKKVVRFGPTVAPAYLRALAAKIEERAGRGVDLLDAVLGVQDSTGKLARWARDARSPASPGGRAVTACERRQAELALLEAEAAIAQVRAALARGEAAEP